MLDIKWIRDNPTALVDALVKRSGRREAQSTVDELIAGRGGASTHRIADQAGKPQRRLKGDRQRHALGRRSFAEKLKAEVGDIKTFIQNGEARERTRQGPERRAGCAQRAARRRAGRQGQATMSSNTLSASTDAAELGERAFRNWRSARHDGFRAAAKLRRALHRAESGWHAWSAPRPVHARFVHDRARL